MNQIWNMSIFLIKANSQTFFIFSSDESHKESFIFFPLTSEKRLLPELVNQTIY